jgi:hypothetical protein
MGLLPSFARTFSVKAAKSAVFGTPTLRGQCECGSVGWVATGPSSINFTCHCSVCRKASGQPYLPAAGFKPEQVQWTNFNGMAEVLPPGSRNKRYYCKCCGTYVAEDATRPLGVMALPLSAAVTASKVDAHSASAARSGGQGADTSPPVHGKASQPGKADTPPPVVPVDMSLVPEEYRPNLHLFYADRVVDVEDSAPKWRTLPQGDIMDAGGNRADTDGVYTPRELNGPSPWGPDSAARSQHDSQSGRLRKDVLPASPPRPPYSKVYHFTEVDPIPNHTTYIAPEKVSERVSRKYLPSPGVFVAPASKKRSVVIIGGGHNGLVSAAYLAKAGVDVCVLERRHVIGGAAVTEELYPGFKFSRASYLAGLLRPQIIEDLNLAVRLGFGLWWCVIILPTRSRSCLCAVVFSNTVSSTFLVTPVPSHPLASTARLVANTSCWAPMAQRTASPSRRCWGFDFPLPFLVLQSPAQW